MKVQRTDIVNLLCCPPDPAVPDKYSCLWPQILRKYKCLLERHECMLTKRPRIHELAVPVRTYKRFEKPCLCDENMRRNIEIIHLHKREPTRTVQLSYPAVRRFKQLRNSRFYKRFDQLRRNVVNRNQRLSQLSLYTYLGNSSIYCLKKKREPALSKKRKAKLMARLAELAKPVLPVEPPPPERGEGSTMSPKRLAKLATPNPTYDVHEKPEWHLTKGARKYKASEAILRMSKPVKKVDTLTNPDWDKIQPKALKYKATSRIKEMATPKPKPTEDSTFKKDPFAISPKALKYNPSNRIKEMAEPKDFTDVHNKQDPFAVSPRALRAKCSKRLAEMAKPKEYA